MEAVKVESGVIAGSDDAEQQLVTAQRLAQENDVVAARRSSSQQLTARVLDLTLML